MEEECHWKLVERELTKGAGVGHIGKVEGEGKLWALGKNHCAE